jgi:hypothetical protein
VAVAARARRMPDVAPDRIVRTILTEDLPAPVPDPEHLLDVRG